ncbi:MAG: alpha/beta fold hydrolase [Myxococcales bacterium]|nr:alpha/beta fold hydrolase [Myxococcales bacterium]
MVLAAIAVGTALVLVHSEPPPVPEPRDVFGLAGVAALPRPTLPPLLHFNARDGTKLGYRDYPASSKRLLIFIHGSSYHGGGYHAQAHTLSISDTAQVVLPNLRGHHESGGRPGDVDYIGQLEDDLADLIETLNHQGPVFLGGHSSGAGLALRFAGGSYAQLVDGYLLMAPAIPGSPALREASGGWAIVHSKRLCGLLFLNAFGVHRFDGLPVITFNIPPSAKDGTQTVSYSHRLNLSYHPRLPAKRDLARLPSETLVLVGGRDEAIDADALTELFRRNAPEVEVEIVAPLNHFRILVDAGVLATVQRWLRTTAR